jgi:hypothetical protein
MVNGTKLWMPDDKDRWQHRAVKETGGNQSMIGCVVLAILGWQYGRKPPRFGKIAIINREGFVITDFRQRDGTIHQAHAIGQVQEIVGGLRKLADAMNLCDLDREEMMVEFKKWIAHDYRADQTIEERGLKKGGL